MLNRQNGKGWLSLQYLVQVCVCPSNQTGILPPFLINSKIDPSINWSETHHGRYEIIKIYVLRYDCILDYLLFSKSGIIMSSPPIFIVTFSPFLKVFAWREHVSNILRRRNRWWLCWKIIFIHIFFFIHAYRVHIQAYA